MFSVLAQNHKTGLMLLDRGGTVWRWNKRKCFIYSFTHMIELIHAKCIRHNNNFRNQGCQTYKPSTNNLWLHKVVKTQRITNY